MAQTGTHDYGNNASSTHRIRVYTHTHTHKHASVKPTVWIPKLSELSWIRPWVDPQPQVLFVHESYELYESKCCNNHDSVLVVFEVAHVHLLTPKDTLEPPSSSTESSNDATAEEGRGRHREPMVCAVCGNRDKCAYAACACYGCV